MATLAPRMAMDELYAEGFPITGRARGKTLLSAAHGHGGTVGKGESNFNAESTDALNERFGNLLKLLENGALEKFYGVLPRPSSKGFLASMYRGYVEGLENSHNTQKHFYGQEALRNTTTLPILKQFPFQNLWSAYKLNEGATTLREIYTMIDGNGNETIIYIRLKNDKQCSDKYIEQLAADLLSKGPNEINAFSQNIISKSMQHAENSEFTKAGCYGELTRGELLKQVDPTSLKNIIISNELGLFLSGNGKLISKNHDVKILKYSEPGRITKKLPYYLTASNVFNLIDIAYQPAEALMKDTPQFYLTAMRSLGHEMGTSIRAANGIFGIGDYSNGNYRGNHAGY